MIPVVYLGVAGNPIAIGSVPEARERLTLDELRELGEEGWERDAAAAHQRLHERADVPRYRHIPRERAYRREGVAGSLSDPDLRDGGRDADAAS